MSCAMLDRKTFVLMALYWRAHKYRTISLQWFRNSVEKNAVTI
jgi:hypothetical protein